MPAKNKKEYQRNYYHKNKQYFRDKRKISKKKSRDWLNSLKTPCLICGEAETACIDFHHPDPNTKEFSPGSGLSRNSKAKVLEEISKCVCVCSNCHRKIHAGLLVLEV